MRAPRRLDANGVLVDVQGYQVDAEGYRLSAAVALRVGVNVVGVNVHLFYLILDFLPFMLHRCFGLGRSMIL